MINKLEIIQQIKVLVEHHGDDYLEYYDEYDLEQCLNNAIKIVNYLPENILTPCISMATDGEINFFWKTDDLLLDFGVYENSISYYCKFKDDEYSCDDVFNFKLPKHILELLEE